MGAGKWGKNHIKTLASIKSLGGIVENDPKVRAYFKEQYPEVEVFPNIPMALKKGYDGWILATPAETHFEKGKLLIENKQHVLIEKPLTLNSGNADELVRLAKLYDVSLMVGHVLLFHPAIQKLKLLIDKGKIGKLQYIYSNRLNLGTVRTEENVFWSFAPHDISIFEYLIGSTPKKIHSAGGAFLQDNIHDTTLTTLKYDGNVKAHIFVSWLHPFKEHRMVVIGSEGMLSFEDSSKEKDILFYEKTIDWIDGKPVKKDGPTEIIHYDRSMPLTNEDQYFVEHLEERPDLSDGVNGYNVVRVLEEATKSLFS